MTLPTLTPISWSPPDGMSFETWQEAFLGLMGVQASLPWLLGDCANAGEAAFGEEYPQVIPETTWARETLRNYKWVAEKVDPVNRVTDLSWSHHRLVAKLSAQEQASWLQRAYAEQLTVKALRAALKQAVPGPAGEGGEEPIEPEAEILPPKARPTVEYSDADEDQLESLKRAWNRAGSEVREQFLSWKEDNEKPVFDAGGPDSPPTPKFLRRGAMR